MITWCVLINGDNDKYVAREGFEYSYTDRLEDARIFTSAEEAFRHRCIESEYLKPLVEVLRGLPPGVRRYCVQP